MNQRLALGALLCALATPVFSQCAPQPGDALVFFHGRGTWHAPMRLPIGDAFAHDSIAAMLAGAPPAVRHTARTGIWFGVADGGRLRAFLVGPGAELRQSLPYLLRDLRPGGGGAVAVVTDTGAVAVLQPDGKLRQLAQRGRDLCWNDAGTELVFVAELDAEPDRGLDSTAVCLYRTQTGELLELARGRNDFGPVVDPRSGDVLFASGRTGLAAFWLLRRGASQPTQICNFGVEIGADFVPLPKHTPFWDAISGRVCYETDYGAGGEVWSLEFSDDRQRVIAARIAHGRDLWAHDGTLSFSSHDGTPTTLHALDAPSTATDFGLRKATALAEQRLPVGSDSTGLFSTLKVDWPLVYNAFKCKLGWRNNPSHPGHDFDAPRFTQQYAAGDGVVLCSVDGWGTGLGGDRGNHISIRHDWLGRSTTYWHLQAGTVWSPPANTFVGVGMPIGRTGDSGGAHSVPHVHFGLFTGSCYNEDWKDPTAFYAVDLLASAPDRYAPASRSPGSCEFLQLPVPDYVRLPAFDSLPPTFAKFRVRMAPAVGTHSTLDFEVDIADPSGVHDEPGLPTFQNPNARGVYLVINPNEYDPMFPGSRTARIPMSLVSGDKFRGTYRTDYPFRVSNNGTTPPALDRFNYAVVADDEALQGFSWLGIGNGGYSRWVSITEVLPETADTELAMIDLAAEIVESPTRIAPGLPFDLAIIVRNYADLDYQGGYEGTVAISPVRDNQSPLYVRTGTFAIPPIKHGQAALVRVRPFAASPLLLIPQNIIVSIDGPNDPNPDNSAWRRPVQVVAALPDLVIEDLRCENEIGHGETLSITGRVTNTGMVPASGRIWIGLGLSLDQIPNNGNDFPLGLFPLDLGTLAPQQSVPFQLTSLVVPPSAVPGQWFLIACVDTGFQVVELNEMNNCADRPVKVIGPEVGITLVEPLSNGIGNHGSVRVRVTLQNFGRGSPFGRVDVSIENANVKKWGNVPFQLGPGGIVRVEATVDTPPTQSNVGGQWETGAVVACHNFIDPVPSNNCGNANVRIDVPWWDLRVSVINAPQTMGRNQWHTWDVNVRNVGNVWSDPKCIRTAISLNSGDSPAGWTNVIFNQCGPYAIQTNAFGPIGPGLDITIPFGMCIHGQAQTGWQHLKAGLNWSFGCTDKYATGDYDERGVFIQ